MIEGTCKDQVFYPQRASPSQGCLMFSLSGLNGKAILVREYNSRLDIFSILYAPCIVKPFNSSPYMQLMGLGDLWGGGGVGVLCKFWMGVCADGTLRV